MPKLIDHNPQNLPPVGNDAILRLIDELNDRRARAGTRTRYRPVSRDGVVGMMEHFAILPPARPNAPSPRYAR